ncbi:unnamed protein product [Kuraishia capsulata CBS 1993]|uniref:Uncharacterized protein n=1 Tax=Kuraishia capsulata CBS 1993 TaxID=1382522 RepID=W6MUY7_9ASCO|nr:unnamed protein product [Kuraishia capsulata CBS 1993]
MSSSTIPPGLTHQCQANALQFDSGTYF